MTEDEKAHVGLKCKLQTVYRDMLLDAGKAMYIKQQIDENFFNEKQLKKVSAHLKEGIEYFKTTEKFFEDMLKSPPPKIDAYDKKIIGLIVNTISELLEVLGDKATSTTTIH